MNVVVNHPVVKEKLTWIRDKNTKPTIFRELVNEIFPFLAYEATKILLLDSIEIETPLAKTNGFRFRNDIVLVPVLRAGLGMMESASRIFPDARIGHVGLYRDHRTFQPVQYYFKLPPIDSNTFVLLLDPMLATGNSIIRAIDAISKSNPWKIQFIGLVASSAGIRNLNHAHPDVDIFVAAIDENLNDSNYIVPGLGDAGNRLFGTI